MASKCGYLVGIFGGIGAGKKTLAEKLTRHLRDPRIQIFCQNQNPPHLLDYRIFLDRPYDQLLEKYIIGLPAKKLQDKDKLRKDLEGFRRFHLEKVMPERLLADVWFSGVDNEDKIHQLALEIMKKRRDFDEDENVKIYLEANNGSQRSHPEKLDFGNSEIF